MKIKSQPTTVSEAVRRFVWARRTDHNTDLVKFWCQHCPNLDTTVVVAQGKGYPVFGDDGKAIPNVYSDGVDEWWNIVWPKRTREHVTFNDYRMRWPLDEHATSIGSSGWDWVHRRSLFIGIDIDSTAGHEKGNADVDLAKITEAVGAVPWIEVRRSTSGMGLHLYARLGDGVPTDNYTAHGRLGQYVLAKLSAEIGFDLKPVTDRVGGTMWFWDRRIEK